MNPSSAQLVVVCYEPQPFAHNRLSLLCLAKPVWFFLPTPQLWSPLIEGGNFKTCLRGSSVSIRYEWGEWRFLTVLGAFIEGWSLIRVSRSPSLHSSRESRHDVILGHSLSLGICSYSSISSSSNSHILPLEFPSFFSSLGGTVVRRMRHRGRSSSSLSSSLPLMILIAEMTGLSSVQA